MNNGYTFKWKPELIWIVVITVGGAFIQLMFDFDVDEVFADPETWAKAVLAALVRSLGAGLMNLLKAAMASDS